LGVVHGDIQPANILYDPRTHRVKIIDFGSANKLQGVAEQTRFEQGVISDFTTYTHNFVLAVMRPQVFFQPMEDRYLGPEELIRIRTMAARLTPDMEAASRGQLPQSYQFSGIWRAYRLRSLTDRRHQPQNPSSSSSIAQSASFNSRAVPRLESQVAPNIAAAAQIEMREEAPTPASPQSPDLFGADTSPRSQAVIMARLREMNAISALRRMQIRNQYNVRSSITPQPRVSNGHLLVGIFIMFLFFGFLWRSSLGNIRSLESNLLDSIEAEI